MLIRKLMVFLSVILLIGLVSASFEIGNLSHSIEKNYGPKDYIKGWLNISLDEEPSNSIIETNFQDSISLKDLLELNSGFVKTCSTKDCSSDYISNNPQSSEEFELSKGEEVVYGIKFTGQITSIKSINFSIQSDAEKDCNNQLKVDILNDGVIDTGNIKTSEEICSSLRGDGCFDETGSTELGIIGVTPYCQKITLSESPGFILGAWVKKGAEHKDITMYLYDGYGIVDGGNCTLPEADPNGGEVSCSINYLVTKSKEYYVCINSDDGGDYKIKASSSPEEKCGFQGYPKKTENAAYYIFATGKKFDSIGKIEINNSLQNGKEFSIIAENYIKNRYGKLDCSDACIIPIKFISDKEQKVKIENLRAVYDKTNVQGSETTEFYELEESPAKISAGFQKISLDKANFSAPSSYGNATFILRLGGNEAFSEKISVQKIPIVKNLRPIETAAAVPTIFRISVESENNITKYFWDFGDSKNQSSTTNRITHVYNSTGKYSVKITAKDSKGKEGYGIFEVDVKSPESVINTTLKEKLGNLENVTKQIEELPLFYKDSIKAVLDLDNVDSELSNLQRDYKGASSESDYITIFTKLLKIEVPEEIVESKSADSIDFYSDENEIDLEVLKEAGGGDYDSSDESKYIDAILFWNQENLESKMTFKEFSARYGNSREPIVRVFEIQFNNKDDWEERAYLFIKKMENLSFKENYLEDEGQEYYIIELERVKDTIMFYTTEDVDFGSLPAFVSPSLTDLDISKTNGIFNGVSNRNKIWIILISIIISVLILAYITYIIMQQWYKTKYENYLFKNKNNLYNLINYIDASKKKGMANSEIEKNLKKSGWKSEQIAYVMKKYSGKQAGMVELPGANIVNILGKGKDNREPPKSFGMQGEWKGRKLF